MRWRSTNRSRTRGYFVIGSSVIGCSSLSTRAEQLWRVLPLMSIVQAPHTSSRHPLSHTGGVVWRPSLVTGWAAIHWRQAMMFRLGRWGTPNSSHRSGLPGPSCRRMRMTTFLVESIGVLWVLAGFISGANARGAKAGRQGVVGWWCGGVVEGIHSTTRPLHHPTTLCKGNYLAGIAPPA